MVKRIWIRLALSVVAVVLCGSVAAQSYPLKPIRLVVPYGPGGAGDLLVRIMTQKMSDAMGQPIIIENRPSAGGILGAATVAKAPPDGYTLLLLSNAYAIGVSLFKTQPFDVVQDFAMVSTMADFHFVLVAAADSRIKSVGDIVAQEKSSPGSLNIATIAVGSTQHLAAELFKAVSGVNATIVPFTNTGEVIAAVRSGRTQVGFETIAPVLAQVSSGALRIVAVCSAQRVSFLPDVPTIAESGLPRFEAVSWSGIAAPAGTPRPVIERLNREIRAALASPDVIKRFEELGVEARSSTPEEMSALLASSIAKWEKVIRTANIERQ